MITRRWKQRTRDPAPSDDVLPHEIDFHALRSLVMRLEQWEGYWHDLFERIGVAPLELWYEDDLEVGYEPAVLQVLDAAGIDRPHDLVVHSDYQTQRDEWSEAMVQIYKDLERRGL